MKEKQKTSGCISIVEIKERGFVRIMYYTICVLVIMISFVMLLPLLWGCLSAFKDTQEFLKHPASLFPHHIDFGKLVSVFKKTNLTQSFLATIVMTLGCIVSNLGVNGLAGYALSKLKPAGSEKVSKLIFMTLLLPTSMSTVPLFMFFIDLPVVHVSLKNSFWPIWMMAGANAFNIILVKNFFDGIPTSYLEAAKVDGATHMQIFAKIMMPLSLPLMFTLAIFTFNGSWGQFFWPYILISKQELIPMGLKVFLLQQKLSIDEYLMTLLIMILPVIIVFIIFQKNIMKGISIGGIKG